MSFQPVLPLTGYGGWTFLSRTRDAQQDAFDKAPALTRDTTYFTDNIASITSAEALVSDRQLLEVALGAFGLEADINNKAFLQKVLEDGSLEPDALANRLSDKRYLEFTKAFGFGDFPVPNTQLSDFGDQITRAYLDQSFEIAIGEIDSNMRLALGAQREVTTLATRDISDAAKWFTMMGNAPMRQVFDTAFGLPESFGTLDLDRQLEEFRDRATAQLGSSDFADFADPEAQETLLRNFLIRAEAQAQFGASIAGQTALTLLQNRITPPSA